MAVKRPKFAAALTLIEVMAAIVVLAVAVLGASGYRYFAVLDARKADVQITAARIALLLCESWRGMPDPDPNSFDPTQLANPPDLTIETHHTGPVSEVLTDFELLGLYRITATDSGFTYLAALSSKDISSRLRALNVVVAWEGRGSGSNSSRRRTFRLTTYTPR